MDEKWIEELRKTASEGKGKAPANLLANIRKTMAERGIAPVSGQAAPERGHSRLLSPVLAAAALACVLALPLFMRTGQQPDSAAGRFAAVPSDDAPAALSEAGGESLLADVRVADNQVYASGLTQDVSGGVRDGGDFAGIPDARTFLKGDMVVGEAAAETAEDVAAAGENAVNGGETEIASAGDDRETGLAENGREAEEGSAAGKTKAAAEIPADDYDAFREPAIRKKTRGRISVGASFAGASGVSGFSGGGGDAVMMAAEPFGTYSDAVANAEVNSMPGYTIDVPEPDEHHDRPLRFGLSVRYPLSGRLSVGSGAVFSYLSSTFESESPSSVSRVRQRLHFIGIPLNLSYRLAGSGRFSLYVSGNGMAEWLVGGRSVTRDALIGYSASCETRNVSDGRTYFSAGVSLGAQYRFAGRVSVYFEPGVMHHFGNGTRVRSSYTENPTDLDFQIGLRFSL